MTCETQVQEGSAGPSHDELQRTTCETQVQVEEESAEPSHDELDGLHEDGPLEESEATKNTTAGGETNAQDYHPRTHYLLRNRLRPIHPPQYF